MDRWTDEFEAYWDYWRDLRAEHGGWDWAGEPGETDERE